MNNFMLILCSLLLSSTDILGVALLIPRDIEIPIYCESNEREIKEFIINDSSTEDYPYIGIYAIDDHMALVHVEYVFKSRNNLTGWIDTKYLGIHLADILLGVNVYMEPSYNSEIAFNIIDGRWVTFYQVIDAYDDWLKIIDPENPDNIGWLSPANQCANPYTPCC